MGPAARLRDVVGPDLGRHRGAAVRSPRRGAGSRGARSRGRARVAPERPGHGFRARPGTPPGPLAGDVEVAPRRRDLVAARAGDAGPDRTVAPRPGLDRRP